MRYADDLVILCRGDIRKPLALLKQILDRLGLTLNETKTHIVNAFEASFDFLGFSFQMRQSKKSRKWYPHTEPSKKSIQRIKDKAKSLTDRKLTLIPVDRLMGALNRSVHGWCNYFQYRNSSAALGEVKWYVEERVRTHLRKRHKIRCRGTGLRRFTSEILYPDSFYCIGCVASAFQLLRQFGEELVSLSCVFYGSVTHSVNAGRASVCMHKSVGMFQYVLPVDLVIEGVESKAFFLLGLVV